ncbi:MAG: hypothetical protein AB7F25_09890 [Deferribacterales bacterium]
MICIVLFYVKFTDPYSFYKIGSRDWDKFSELNIRYIKFKQIESIKPSCLILGTSRAAEGYDPENCYFDNNTYNSAVSAGTVYEMLQYTNSALKQRNLKKVLFSLDYGSFNAKFQIYEKNFYYYDLLPTTIYTFLVRSEIMKDGIKKISKSQRDKLILYTGSGETTPTNFNKYLHYHNIDIFLEKLPIMYLERPIDYRYGDTKRNSFEDFMKILDVCYKNNVEVTLVFNPSHVMQWEAIAYNAGYGSWLKWKKDVVGAVYKSAEEHRAKPFTITDFAVYNSITTEKISNEMEYYYDTSHFKRFVGDMVLQRLKSGVVNDGFGIELNPQMIDGYLEKMKHDRVAFLKQYLKENGSLFSKTSADFGFD